MPPKATEHVAEIEEPISPMAVLVSEWVPLPHDMIAPSSWRESVSCTDECETCPLYLTGCAQECVRWSDLVCKQCPCLGSAYARWLVATLTRLPNDHQSRQ